MDETSVLVIAGVVVGFGVVGVLVTWLVRAGREYLLERAKSRQ